MLYVIKFLYGVLLFPPGLWIIVLLAASCWAYRRNRAVAKVLAAITLVIYLFSVGLLADPLIHSLESKYSPPAEPRGDVIIMLGGGATLDTPNIDGQGHLGGSAANRLLTAAQLYYKLGVPIIVSGGKVYETSGAEAEIARRILVGLGIPDNKILVENASLNTSQNAQFTAAILRQYGFKQPILVTSAFHMPRSVLQFAKAGVAVVPFPTDYQANIASEFGAAALLPSGHASGLLVMSLKEYVGIAAVRWY
ncbi:MAG: YdcF family protein [Negativicutes bacterium]|nr:YdcF family protein [Negativicutes bacterium]